MNTTRNKRTRDSSSQFEQPRFRKQQSPEHSPLYTSLTRILRVIKSQHVGRLPLLQNFCIQFLEKYFFCVGGKYGNTGIVKVTLKY